MAYQLILLLEVFIIAYTLQYIFYGRKLGTPTVSGSRKYNALIISLLPPEPGQAIVDLGSGYGGLALAMARARPGCTVTGIEYAPVPYVISRIRKWLNPALGNLRFVRQDFFSYPLDKTSVVTSFILEPVLEKLKGKFASELPDGALIISNTYKIPGWTPERVIEPGRIMDEKSLLLYRISRQI